jgi:hypothetical protein
MHLSRSKPVRGDNDWSEAISILITPQKYHHAAVESHRVSVGRWSDFLQRKIANLLGKKHTDVPCPNNSRR